MKLFTHQTLEVLILVVYLVGIAMIVDNPVAWVGFVIGFAFIPGTPILLIEEHFHKPTQ